MSATRSSIADRSFWRLSTCDAISRSYSLLRSLVRSQVADAAHGAWTMPQDPKSRMPELRALSAQSQGTPVAPDLSAPQQCPKIVHARPPPEL
eukprot:5192765-Alexandrium_andersonii.AAC.1